ncbi:cilia- and flagella-associated protein 251-like [Cyprinodon tularosa]|uniref:cilia- and flagella-associated protein 251-like n=1 Tax=Cyprinodon tularosa TaxID=77115 RepID=UPI0018E22C17|nr:cilia- and flagella-associated protein 251-like [Cyprinodon tularosa]
MKRKAKSGDITSFFAKKIPTSTQEEERKGNEGEGSKLESPGGSVQEKTEGDTEISDEEEEIHEGDTEMSEGNEEISAGAEEKEESVRDEEEAPDSERGTDAGNDQEEEEDDREEEGRPEILPGPHDISKCKGDAAVQPDLKTFPKTQHGAAKRSFHREWYSSWPWLEYSMSKDAAFCFAF